MSEHYTEIPIDISSQFNVLGYPNGGYLTRLAAETLAVRSAHPDLLAIHASFVGHPVSGPAIARISDLGSTKSLSRAMLALVQNDELKAHYIATFTDFSRTAGATARLSNQPVDITPFPACINIDSLALPAPMQSFVSQFNLHLAPGSLQNFGPDRTAAVEGWISLADESPSTLESLVLFADAFPPPVYNVIEPAAWDSVPTIEYSVYLKARPVPGPIHARFVSNEVCSGLLVIDGELRDSDGRLLAESRQLAKFRGSLASVRGTAD
ncbi:thioesterase family protein [Burkholderia cepacia]|uniref:thioesterase family protein n=1 Tax=Burkholderia cepacia TaxID=292 RepID=UPI00249E3218|nr:thioesterase family protein [Burkholderia cepacia]WGY71377.1 thioesterase family protein [Burkholderia cepacia]